MVWVCPEPKGDSQVGPLSKNNVVNWKQKVEESGKKSAGLQAPLGLLGSCQEARGETQSEQNTC